VFPDLDGCCCGYVMMITMRMKVEGALVFLFVVVLVKPFFP
jgi:hypothetical protein